MTSSILEIEDNGSIVKMKKNGEFYVETTTVYDDSNTKQEVITNHTSIKEVKDSKGNIIEVQLVNDKDGDEVWLVKTNDFGEESWVKAKRTTALIHEFSYREDLENKVFQAGLPKEVSKILDIWEEVDNQYFDDRDKFIQFINKLDYSPYNTAIIEAVERRIVSEENGYDYDINDILNSTSLKGMLYSGFENYHKIFTNEIETKIALDNFEELSGLLKGDLLIKPFTPDRKGRL